MFIRQSLVAGLSASGGDDWNRANYKLDLGISERWNNKKYYFIIPLESV